MRLRQIFEARRKRKKKPKQKSAPPRPSVTITVTETREFKKARKNKPERALKKVFAFVDLFKAHKLKPADTNLANQIKAYRPHPIKNHGVNAAWIMPNLRLWYKEDGSNLVLANLEDHDGYNKKR